MKKAIFLDRDGTIIVDKHYLNDPDQIEYLPGVFEAFKLWSENGYQFIVVTNQSGVHKGIVQEENIEEIHQKIAQRMVSNGTPILDFYYAPQASDSDHPMRKPNPGMLLQAAKEHHINLHKSWMVGDKMSDVEAGHRAGCKSILLTHDSTKDLASSTFQNAEIKSPLLLEAANQSILYRE